MRLRPLRLPLFLLTALAFALPAAAQDAAIEVIPLEAPTPAATPEPAGNADTENADAPVADVTGDDSNVPAGGTAPEMPAAMPDVEMSDMGVVVLRTIDKLSARRHTFDIPVDKTVKFGDRLFIKVRACRQSSPLSLPESAAFLQIWEKSPEDGASKWVFSGWMFSSNPALSAMDHPVYDVWVIDCKNSAASAKDSEFSTEETPDTAPESATPESVAPAAE